MTLHPGPEKSRVLEVKRAEVVPIRQAFHDNEDWYQDLVEHSQDLLCTHDLEGRLLSLNPAPARVLGYTVVELLHIPMRELIAPEFRSYFDDYLSQIEREGESRGLMHVMTRSGDRRIWEYHNTLRRDGVASPIVRGMARDVTDQRETEKLLREVGVRLLAKVRESEHTIRELELFRTLVNQSNDAIKVIDPETLRILDVNEKACSELGYSREELLSLRVFDIDPAVTEASAAKVKEQLQKSGSFMLEALHRRKDGSTFQVEVSMRRVQLEREYIVAIARDLTERRLVEEALRTSEQRQHRFAMQLEAERARLIEAQAVAKVGSWEAELPSLKITWSEQTHGIFETDPSHFHPRRQDFVEFIHPEDRAKVDAAFQASLDKGEPSNVEYRIVMADGRVKVLEEEWRVFHDEQGEPLRLMGTCRDITNQKRAEEALRRNEENYRLFVSQSSEGIFREEFGTPVSVDLPEDEMVRRILYNAYIAECNDALAAMYGASSGKELQGRYWKELAPPEEPQNIEMTRQFVRSGFRLLEHRSHEIDIHGNPKVFLNSVIGTVENGMLVRTWGIQRDVTETVKLEESRQKAEAELRHTVSQLCKVTAELGRAKEKLSEEKLYLEEAIDTELGFGEIVGRSDALKAVLEKVTKVAPSDATVLLLGETGTGKELVARALHRLSKRQGNSFIKLNCAAIPSGLLESELFGHEKGAFTGAVARKLGRLELADHGTLFLDEIGEIPLSLQPKLLRVLQDMEFERLGGTQTLKVNFRLLAATNRELPQSVKAHEFRSDLYYRLSVFPILIPPLRERREDIRPLIEHFVRRFSNQMKKSIISVPTRTMELLVRWDWPGNIRELENFVERSVILTPGSVLQAPLSELQPGDNALTAEGHVALRDKERERLLRTLKDCNGRLGGPDGAAARLGLKRTTLQSKLDHLGIKPGAYRV